MSTSDFIWAVRTFIYNHFVATARAPRVAEIAQHFDLSPDAAGEALVALNEQHVLFLEPGTLDIRIANPFSAVPTPFEVEVNGRRYWANCAWDSFGIPAALHADAASIFSECAHTHAPLQIRLQHGEVQDTHAVIHFLVPFQHWYEDMVFT
jgi:hypothetical protein